MAKRKLTPHRPGMQWTLECEDIEPTRLGMSPFQSVALVGIDEGQFGDSTGNPPVIVPAGFVVYGKFVPVPDA